MRWHFRSGAKFGALARYLAKATSGSLLLKLGNIILLLGVSVILGRILGPGGFGHYAFALSIARVLANPSMLGLQPLNIREMPVFIRARQWSYVAGLISFARTTTLLIGVSIAGLLGTWAILAAGDVWDERYLTLAIAAIAVPLLAQVRVQGAILRGLGWILLGQWPQFLLLPAVVFAATLCVVGFGRRFDPHDAVLIYVFATLATLVVGGLAIRWVMPQYVRSVRGEWLSRKWLLSAFPLTIAMNLGIFNNELATLVLGILSTPEQVGLYRVAQRGADLTLLGLAAVNMAIGPTCSRLYAEGQYARLQRVASWGARAALAFAVPVALLLALKGKELLSFVFGEAFAPGATPLAALALAQTFNAAMGPVAVLLHMTGHERDTARGIMIAVGVNGVLAASLVPQFGASGAAISTAASLGVWNIYLVRCLMRRTGIASHAFQLLSD